MNFLTEKHFKIGFFKIIKIMYQKGAVKFTKGAKFEFFNHQKFVRDYINMNAPYGSIAFPFRCRKNMCFWYCRRFQR